MTSIEALKPVSRLRCRQIVEADLDAVVGLLRKGFVDRSEAYWRKGLARHVGRPLPDGYPTYGYLLEVDDLPVGVLLTLHTARGDDGHGGVRCNLSSWYVDPAFRSHGSLLEKVATRRSEITYLDVTPSTQTWPVIEARGFRRYCTGQMLAVPMLSRPRPDVAVRVIGPTDPMNEISAADRTLMRDHLGYGCLCLIGIDADGPRPLVFRRRTVGVLPNVRRFGRISCMQLIYAHATADVARFARAMAPLLLRHGRTPLIVVDAVGPLRGLVGRYFEGRGAKYARGPHPVALGDLAYTELVLFGP